MNDPLIYDDDIGHYVGHFGEDGWYRWPARADGWLARRKAPAPRPEDGFYELDSRQVHLAIVASGVE